ncbi:hypothetical protein ACTFRD_26145 [Bacillus cereus group sp. MYBK249-1]|uniref:hypothetical protein n=1 Tax=unclassified Bacillus cereus group TaxID=2750818 RepID=UPI003F7A8F84
MDYGKAIKLKPFSIAFDKVSLNLLNLITLDKRTNKKTCFEKIYQNTLFLNSIELSFYKTVNEES